MFPKCRLLHIFSVTQVAREHTNHYMRILPLFMSRVMNIELILSSKGLSTPNFLTDVGSVTVVSNLMTKERAFIPKRLATLWFVTNEGSLASLKIS